ncbi:MAG: hypothetical protein RLZZ200_494, partial [Pseudomonadota bacterium]
MKSGKAPKPTAAQAAMEASQLAEVSRLDAEENKRRKRLLAAAQGVRVYTGSPLMRAPASNTAGTAAVPTSAAI